MNSRLNKIDLIKLFILSLLFVTPKWLLSYYFFDEEITLRIINEIDGDGEFYLPLIKSLAEFNFANSYSILDQINGYIPIPIGTLFLHSFFYLFIGSYSIILTEIIYVLLYLLFLSLIQKIYFEHKNIIYLSFLIILIPTFIETFNLNEFQYLNIISSNFFGLRIHRPLGTTIFLIIFIYILLNIFEKNLNKSNSFFLGLLLGLTFSGFYYFFLIQATTILILILINFNFKIFNYLKLHFTNLIITVFGFCIFAIPFIINILMAEQDFAERAGAVFLSQEKKVILLEYYLGLFYNLKFQIIIFFNLAVFFLFLKLKINNILFYKIPFIIFVSSLISPFLFFLLFNKTSLIYHFNNSFIICSFISILFFIVSFYHNYLTKKKKFKLDFLLYSIIIFLLFNSSNNQFNKNNELKKERNELSELSKILQKNNLTTISILTFDNKVMIWSIMRDVKDLKIINGLLTPKKNDMIERDVINAFKFLNFDLDIFSNFIENKNIGWRYFNENISNLFYARYQANKFKTYLDSKNFNNDELKKILESPPSMNQQFIIPINEIDRLKDKFRYKSENYKILPDYIILNKSNFIHNNLEQFPNGYCEIYNKSFFLVLSSNNCN